jgi:uracil-DNA glycosylase
MFGGHSQTIDSYTGWWADAGLIDAVSDHPFDWLAPVAPPAPVTAPRDIAALQRATLAQVAPAATTASDEKPVALPGDLAAFDTWLTETIDLPGLDWSMQRVLPYGPADAPLMLLADAPDPADIEAGRLFSGAQGKLIDAMLAAIGLTRDACRIGSIALTRPIGGRLDGSDADRLTAIARRHIALAKPRALLLVGQQSAQLVAGEGVSPALRQLEFNHDGVTVAAFAIHHPRLLLERPLLKRPAWEVLKRVRELA